MATHQKSNTPTGLKGLVLAKRILRVIILLPLVLWVIFFIVLKIHPSTDPTVSQGYGWILVFMTWAIIPFIPLYLLILLINVIAEFSNRHAKNDTPSETTENDAQIQFEELPPQELPQPIQTTYAINDLLGAVINGTEEQVRLTLSQHPEQLNTAYAGNGNTPLHVASWNGHKDIVKLLLAQPNIDTRAKNLADKTALDLAKEKNFTEIIELLKFTEQK